MKRETHEFWKISCGLTGHLELEYCYVEEYRHLFRRNRQLRHQGPRHEFFKLFDRWSLRLANYVSPAQLTPK